MGQLIIKGMQRLQAYKFRLYAVDRATETMFWQHAGACRWIWNECLTFQNERQEQGKKRPGWAWLCRALTALRKHPETAWLAETSAPAQQRSIANLEKAWERFFEDLKKPPALQSGVKPPVLKKKGRHDAFGWSGEQHCQLDQANSRIRVPKMGWLRYRKSRCIEGVVKNVTIARKGKHWYIAIQTVREIPEVVQRDWHEKSQRLGIDMGIACHTAWSDGQTRRGPQPLKAAAANLARKQRQLARKVKGSNRYKKQSRLIGRIYERIGSARLDHLHKLSTEISKNHGLVAIEDLQVRNMSRNAKGTKEVPGVNVSAKKGLNRAILDQGWSELRRQLVYKQSWTGGTLIAVPPRNTSRMCSACAYTDKANRPSQAVFICGGCGVSLHADVNAAKNILAAGLAATARRGSALRRPLTNKRVPAEPPRAA